MGVEAGATTCAESRRSSERKTIADLLQAFGGGTAQDTIVECFERDLFLRQLALGIFMAVQAQLGIEWKVAAELEEEGAEIPVHRIDVVVIHHRGRAYDPWIGLPGLGTPALLGAEYWRLLLSLADEHHPFFHGEFGQIFCHNLVLALPLAKLHERNLMLYREALQRSHKPSRHWGHQGRGRQR